MTKVLHLGLFAANIVGILTTFYTIAKAFLYIEYALDIFKRCYYFNYPPYTWCEIFKRKPLPSEALLWAVAAIFTITILVILNSSIDKQRKGVL